MSYYAIPREHSIRIKLFSLNCKTVKSSAFVSQEYTGRWHQRGTADIWLISVNYNVSLALHIHTHNRQALCQVYSGLSTYITHCKANQSVWVCILYRLVP